MSNNIDEANNVLDNIAKAEAIMFAEWILEGSKDSEEVTRLFVREISEQISVKDLVEGLWELYKQSLEV